MLLADAMSRIETRALDETDLEDHIPCFTCGFEEAEEPDMELLPPFCTGNDICLTVEPGSSPEPIKFSEWIKEQEIDPFCQDIRRKMNYFVHTRFLIDEEGLLKRISPLDGSQQIVVPKSLQDRILRNSHYPAVCGHPGGRRLTDTVRLYYLA